MSVVWSSAGKVGAGGMSGTEDKISVAASEGGKDALGGFISNMSVWVVGGIKFSGTSCSGTASAVKGWAGVSGEVGGEGAPVEPGPISTEYRGNKIHTYCNNLTK